MAQHIYMSESAGTPVLGKVVGLSSATKFRHRGEAEGSHDDPQSFRRMMAKKGFLVAIQSTEVGTVEMGSGVKLATATDLGLTVVEGSIVDDR